MGMSFFSINIYRSNIYKEDISPEPNIYVKQSVDTIIPLETTVKFLFMIFDIGS